MMLLTLPFVLFMEFLDALMGLIPQRLWQWIWRDATTATAGAVDTSIRVVLVGISVTGIVIVWCL